MYCIVNIVDFSNGVHPVHRDSSAARGLSQASAPSCREVFDTLEDVDRVALRSAARAMSGRSYVAPARRVLASSIGYCTTTDRNTYWQSFARLGLRPQIRRSGEQRGTRH